MASIQEKNRNGYRHYVLAERFNVRKGKSAEMLQHVLQHYPTALPDSEARHDCVPHNGGHLPHNSEPGLPQNRALPGIPVHVKARIPVYQGIADGNRKATLDGNCGRPHERNYGRPLTGSHNPKATLRHNSPNISLAVPGTEGGIMANSGKV